MLIVSEISAGYESKLVLKRVSFSVASNEVVAVMGPSGSGKSTLVKVLSGLMPSREGCTSFDGNGHTDVAVMFQSPLLQPWFNVAENISLPARVKGATLDVEKLTKAVGLDGCENRYPFQLSGGEQRRVALARALGCSPAILFLDEPFTGVDELTRERLFELLGEVLKSRQIPCILITHNPYESVYLSDRILLLGGTPSSIVGEIAVSLDRPRSPELLTSTKFSNIVNEVRHRIREQG